MTNNSEWNNFVYTWHRDRADEGINNKYEEQDEDESNNLKFTIEIDIPVLFGVEICLDKACITDDMSNIISVQAYDV